MLSTTATSYTDRLHTFQGYWDANLTTVRQLAAIGHVPDRPPLESLDEGSRCITCSQFVAKDVSVKALEGAISQTGRYTNDSFTFHHVGCTRLQVRIPLDPQENHSETNLHTLDEIKRRFEPQRTPSTEGSKEKQSSSLFSLPTEIRLQIYAMILPSFLYKLEPSHAAMEIVPLNRESSRVITKAGFEKIGRRDNTKTNILHTCRTVYDEAMDMLFTNVNYKFANAKVLYLFLRQIGHTGRQFLQSIDIYCGGREDAMAFALLGSCPRLSTIIIRMPRPNIMLPRAPIWCVDGMTCLLDLSGLKEVKFGRCATLRHMVGDSADAAVIRRALTRMKGTKGGLRFIDGYLDL